MVLRGFGRYQARLKRAALARIKREEFGVVWGWSWRGLGRDLARIGWSLAWIREGFGEDWVGIARM